MSNERLTRQELSWLLAQEARGAAKALREGVAAQRKQPRPGPVIQEAGAEVEVTLDVLDDAIGMLSELQSGPQSRGRRGRIDLAALLCNVAPNARIVMEPGAGTEVFGEETELTRMLHVLVNQTHAEPSAAGTTAAPDVHIRRQDDWVRIGVALGPDTSATGELERRWLSRMAVRHGGRMELEGGMQSVLLPADGASDQREVVELRKELEQAQQLGEAYARELAAAFSAGELPVDRPSSPLPDTAPARVDLLVSTAAALVRLMRDWIEGLRGESTAATSELGDGAPLAQSLARRVSGGYEVFAELNRLAECPRDEAERRVDLVDLTRNTIREAEARAARHGVDVVLEAERPITAEVRRTAFAILLRALVDHGIAATPRGGKVVVRLNGREGGVELAVEDGGPGVPENARSGLMLHRVDPTSLGRPAGLALLIAATLAPYLGSPLGMRERDGRTETFTRLGLNC